jgi:exodeoxyribonuclease V alpha subunit
MSLLQALHAGGWLRAVDHALGLSLRHAREETPDWVQAAAALASRALAQGHSQLPLAEVASLLAEVDSERAPPVLPPAPEWRALLAVSPWVHEIAAHSDGAGLAATPPDRVLVLEGDTVALRRYHDLEVRLARALLARTDPAAPRLQLVTGGPGTGKTTRVAQLLVDAARDEAGDARPLRVLLAAPTGKAASRLSESVRESLTRQVLAGTLDARIAAQLPTEASTVHRLLGWQGRDGFRHHRDNPLPADLVVVDEASMIDLPLMCRLVEAVAPDARLVLVGDRDQLPSVDIGDVLAALCDASEAAGSPLAARREHLRHSHRQAGNVDVPVLAGLVRVGDADAVMQGLASNAFRGVHWRDGGDRALQDAVLEAALPHYRALADHTSVEEALRAARGYRVLCAMREGPAGSVELNAALGAALDPLQGGEGWFRGRLLIVTENSYRQQLFNGDIGIVWADEFGEPRVWFDADGGPRAWLPAALPAHAPAFALTVHKSQGSEFERVFLALPAHGTRVLSRELLYTGLTRCRSEVTLWAGEGALREAIARRAQRWSGLAARLATDAPDAPDATEGPAPPAPDETSAPLQRDLF